MEVKVKCIMPVPRFGSTASIWQIQDSLATIGLGVQLAQSVFWHEAMEREYESALDGQFDWILAIDYDSMFRPHHVVDLMKTFAGNPNCDALAALQVARGKQHALAWKKHGGESVKEWSGSDPFPVEVAHFGLTLIRCSRIAMLPKPWFQAEPDELGGWGAGHLHADVSFWTKWRTAGNSLWIDPRCKIGHLEDKVTWFDEKNRYRCGSIAEWRSESENRTGDRGQQVGAESRPGS